MPRRYTRRKTVTHSGTNRAQCRVTWFMRQTTLPPLRQTTIKTLARVSRVVVVPIIWVVATDVRVHIGLHTGRGGAESVSMYMPAGVLEVRPTDQFSSVGTRSFVWQWAFAVITWFVYAQRRARRGEQFLTATESACHLAATSNRARQLYNNISMLFLFPVKDGKLSTGVNATFNASCYG